MIFHDTTTEVNGHLEPGAQPYALFLSGGGADIAVSGSGNRWMVAVYWNYNEAETYVSQVAFSWNTRSEALAIRLAWYVAKRLEPFAPAERWPNLIPARLRMHSVTGEVVTEDMVEG